MPKNKKKKKFLQGMEHLKQEIGVESVQSTSETSTENSISSSHSILKKELLSAMVLISVLTLVLVGLMILDQQTNYINSFASKVMSFINK
ncbi:hypothetical protein KKF61_02220 [Patescibacteria group bacterium]|nr:hypothetical protein [Patescibacteria group bacterium]MBU0963831.1 hypothetical protein [Patescibacteria group bacterium]